MTKVGTSGFKASRFIFKYYLLFDVTAPCTLGEMFAKNYWNSYLTQAGIEKPQNLQVIFNKDDRGFTHE